MSEILGQSPEQKEMIKNIKEGQALYVEGAFRVWLREKQVKIPQFSMEPTKRKLI